MLVNLLFDCQVTDNCSVDVNFRNYTKYTYLRNFGVPAVNPGTGSIIISSNTFIFYALEHVFCGCKILRMPI